MSGAAKYFKKQCWLISLCFSVESQNFYEKRSAIDTDKAIRAYRLIERKEIMARLILFATFLSLIPLVVTDNGDPTIPEQIPKFQSSVEINQPGQGFSTGVKEYYDSRLKRSAVFITQMGETEIIIHDHLNGEILDIKESIHNKYPVYSCKVEKFGQDFLLSSFINPSWLLRETTKTKENYVPGAPPIRGIPVNHWKADIAINGGNITVHYFYSEPSWENKYKLNQVPVQVKITGSFNIVYDYYDFLNDIPDESVFQTPEGAYCPNRTSSKSIPKISDQVSYRLEFNSPETEIIFSMDVWMDTRNHFLRIDYSKHSLSGENQLLTEVHDFNLDVNYKIDRVSGKCATLPLIKSDKLDIDIVKKKSASGVKTIRMKHPNEMFNFNHNFQYAGQRVFNGILCDVFIAQVLNYKISGIPFNVTMEYYFTSNNWKEVSNTAIDTEMNVPVLLQIKSFDMSFIEMYRYLDIDEGSMYLSVFDVRSCFKQEDKMDFEVDFTHPHLLQMEEKSETQERCHMTIAKAASISPLRIQNAKLHVDENYIRFVATLVGLPPAYTEFQLDYDCNQLSKNNKIIENIHTSEECAEICQEETSFACNAFGFCLTKKLCSLSKSQTDDGRYVPGAFCCVHFKRMNNLTHTLVPPAKAWMNLKDTVYQGKVEIPIGQTPMVAVDVRNDVMNGANREINSANWQEQFSRVKNHIIEGHDDLVLPGLAVDDCANACFDEDNFYCLSFDFCYSNGECRLSKQTSVMNPQYLKRSSTCDVYTLNYVTWFNKFPGQTILPKLDVVYQRVGTADQCASLCFNYLEFPCKSFDYCELIQTCVIGHTHIFDIPKSQVNFEPMCSHYSIKYITDFKKTSNKMLKLADDEIISDVSEEECAKICTENKKFSCESFDFCSDTQLCMYRSTHPKDIQGDSGLKPSVFCNHYSRIYLPDGTRFSSSHQNYLNPQKTDYSSASMGLLGFFMLIIGIGGGFLGIFFYNRQKKKRKDSLAIRMMKDDPTPIY